MSWKHPLLDLIQSLNQSPLVQATRTYDAMMRAAGYEWAEDDVKPSAGQSTAETSATPPDRAALVREYQMKHGGVKHCTKKSLYERANVDRSDFHKWEKRLKHEDGSSIDLAIRRILSS